MFAELKTTTLIIILLNSVFSCWIATIGLEVVVSYICPTSLICASSCMPTVLEFQLDIRRGTSSVCFFWTRNSTSYVNSAIQPIFSSYDVPFIGATSVVLSPPPSCIAVCGIREIISTT